MQLQGLMGREGAEAVQKLRRSDLGLRRIAGFARPYLAYSEAVPDGNREPGARRLLSFGTIAGISFLLMSRS